MRCFPTDARHVAPSPSSDGPLLAAGAKENGLDLAREVRKDRNIPIIMLTGKGDAIDRVVGLEVGANNGK
jgi:DNA-binding response OmpR family regulator